MIKWNWSIWEGSREASWSRVRFIIIVISDHHQRHNHHHHHHPHHHYYYYGGNKRQNAWLIRLRRLWFHLISELTLTAMAKMITTMLLILILMLIMNIIYRFSADVFTTQGSKVWFNSPFPMQITSHQRNYLLFWVQPWWISSWWWRPNCILWNWWKLEHEWNFNFKVQRQAIYFLSLLFLSVFNKKNLHGITLVISNK